MQPTRYSGEDFPTGTVIWGETQATNCEDRPVRLDRLDAQLIQLLTDSPMLPAMECARRLGVARGTVTSRLSRLQDNGVIEAIVPRIQPAGFEYQLVAFCSVEINQKFGHERVTGAWRAASRKLWTCTRSPATLTCSCGSWRATPRNFRILRPHCAGAGGRPNLLRAGPARAFSGPHPPARPGSGRPGRLTGSSYTVCIVKYLRRSQKLVNSHSVVRTTCSGRNETSTITVRDPVHRTGL